MEFGTPSIHWRQGICYLLAFLRRLEDSAPPQQKSHRVPLPETVFKRDLQKKNHLTLTSWDPFIIFKTQLTFILRDLSRSF